MAGAVRRQARRRPRRAASAPTEAATCPTERREIEAELFDGQLAGVVATTALELGIDVGGLDACVHRRLPRHHRVAVAAGRAGPGDDATVAGRARRRGRPARPVAHGPPREVFTRPPEPAVVNPSNPFVLHPTSRAPPTRRR